MTSQNGVKIWEYHENNFIFLILAWNNDGMQIFMVLIESFHHKLNFDPFLPYFAQIRS